MSPRKVLVYSIGSYMMFLIGFNFGQIPTEDEPEKETFLSRQQYEVCRDKLFTKYPHKVNQKEWSKCLSGND